MLDGAKQQLASKEQGDKEVVYLKVMRLGAPLMGGVWLHTCSSSAPRTCMLCCLSCSFVQQMPQLTMQRLNHDVLLSERCLQQDAQHWQHQQAASKQQPHHVRDRQPDV